MFWRTHFPPTSGQENKFTFLCTCTCRLSLSLSTCISLTHPHTHTHTHTHYRNLVSYDRDASTEREATGDGEEVRGLLDQRAGVYDGDEFDVFRHRNVDLSNVHIGKR